MNNEISETEQADESKKIRCAKCKKVLAKPDAFFGVEIKCARCGTLNRVFEQMIEQVIITDSRGIILFINKAVEAATGYSAHEAIGKKPSELWGGHMPKESYTDMWDKILEKKQSIKSRITNQNKAGELYEVELLVSPILDTNGDVMFFVGIEVIV